MTSDMDRMAGTGGVPVDDGAATGDWSETVSGADAGGATNRTDFASGGTDDADGPAGAEHRSRDRLDEIARTLDGLDEDGGTRIAGPEDRTDIRNLRGGQDDPATGGSDLGASTGGGDTGAV